MARTTDSFFALIEETFDVDTITPSKIMDKFYSGTFGDVKGGWYKSGKKRTQKSQATLEGQSVFMGLAERLSEGREVVEEINRATDFDELRNLRRRAKGLDIYSKEVTERAEDKMKEISEELVKISEERKEKRLEEERLERLKIKQEKQLDKIESKISSARTLGEAYKLESKLDDLEEVDTGEARGLISERIAEIEEEKEENLRRQEEARIAREIAFEEIERTGGGKNPDF